MAQLSKQARGTLKKLALLTVAMFGFGFALVPLYNVFCQITGLNGKTGRIDAAVLQSGQVDKDRLVTIEFTSQVNSGLPWEFRPSVKKMQVHPGEVVTTYYYARNLADEVIVGQAVPSVSPGLAAESFKKLECFCFSRQELKPSEEKQMPVRYVVQPNLPKDIRTITLSYAFFNADQQSARKYGAQDQDKVEEHAVHEHANHAQHNVN